MVVYSGYLLHLLSFATKELDLCNTITLYCTTQHETESLIPHFKLCLPKLK